MWQDSVKLNQVAGIPGTCSLAVAGHCHAARWEMVVSETDIEGEKKCSMSVFLEPAG